jgi:hypothetical protein
VSGVEQVRVPKKGNSTSVTVRVQPLGALSFIVLRERPPKGRVFGSERTLDKLAGLVDLLGRRRFEEDNLNVVSGRQADAVTGRAGELAPLLKGVQLPPEKVVIITRVEIEAEANTSFHRRFGMTLFIVRLHQIGKRGLESMFDIRDSHLFGGRLDGVKSHTERRRREDSFMLEKNDKEQKEGEREREGGGGGESLGNLPCSLNGGLSVGRTLRCGRVFPHSSDRT